SAETRLRDCETDSDRAMGRAPVPRPGTGRQRHQHRESPGLKRQRARATGGHIWRAGRIDQRRRDGAGHDPRAQALKATDMSLLPPSRRWATNAWMALGTVTTCALALPRSSLVSLDGRRGCRLRAARPGWRRTG